MKVVIQCAAKKDPGAGYFQGANGKPVFFVADPSIAPGRKGVKNVRPDDTDADGVTWRQKLVEYNKNPGSNPLGLLPAWQLYANPAYERLFHRFGVKNLYILSAGWGLISADFLTPVYDITFSASAEKYKRRKKRDRYADLRMLPASTDEPVVFLGGKDYVELFSELTADVQGERSVFYNSATPPVAKGCKLRRFETSTRTNWHYEAARALVDSSSLQEMGQVGVRRPEKVRVSKPVSKRTNPTRRPVSRPGSSGIGSKYEPLRAHLAGLSPDTRETTLTFVELEKILGFQLPKSATKYRPWWANQTDTSKRAQAAAWMSAGWKVDNVALKRPGGHVGFRRSR